MNIKYTITVLCAVILGMVSAVSLVGCSSSSFDGYYSGSVSGTLNGSTLSSGTMTMTLHQSGSNVYGDFIITYNSSTTISGVVSGTESGTSTNLSVTISTGQTGAGTVITGNALSLSGSVLSGTMTGTNTSLTLSLSETQ
jgi:hypothetical protein